MNQPKKKKSATSTNSSPACLSSAAGRPAPENVPVPPVKAPTPTPGPDKTRRSRRWLPISLYGAAGVIVVVLGFAGTAYALGNNSIVRGTTVGGVSIGGLNTKDALTKIERAWADYASQQITFTAGSQTISIDPQGSQSDSEGLVTDIASFDAVASVNAAAAFGHQGSWWTELRQRISGLLGRRHEFGKFSFDADAVEDALVDKTAGLNKNPVDAAIEIGETGQPSVTADKSGQSANTHLAAVKAAHQAATFSTAPIAVTTKVVPPTFQNTVANAAIATNGIAAVQGRAPITLKLNDKTWTIDAKQLNKLLGFRTDAAGATKVGFDLTKTTAYLETLRSRVDIKPSEARFEMVNGKVRAFSASQVGVSLDVAATIKALNNSLDIAAAPVNLVVARREPQSESLAATNNLGITELVASATTNFAGSPVNRRYNILLGAKKLNGLLIEPGETFSLITALGKIDAANGWKSELVIKPGGVIKPEYGGGLCQVGTTMFRVALNAGLPIVERKNHSLRISYYEPPIGLDATIYEPHPDLRFTNDYGHALLLQTEVNGTHLTFRFYGTKEGRVVSIPTPKVYNRVGIPAAKTVYVTDLKPGEKKCQTPGHPGADATATYVVTLANGTKRTQVFQSHYMAIGVICRVGKKAAAKPKATNTNTNKSTTNTNTAGDTNSPADTNTAPVTNTPTNTNS